MTKYQIRFLLTFVALVVFLMFTVGKATCQGIPAPVEIKNDGRALTQGGTFMLPDSTTAYQALYGAAPPHVRLRNDATLIRERFFRGTGELRRRYTLYRTGAWVKERYINGKWEVDTQ